MNREFTQQKWKAIVSTALAEGYRIYPVIEWLREAPEVGIVIRHDVDRRPFNALKMAQIESELGISTTYYFRVTKNSFDREIMQQISDLGHEIGYHYEDLSWADGDIEKAKKFFEKHLNQFRHDFDVKTVAMHGRPLSPHNSIDMWKQLDLKSFGIEGEALLSIDYRDFYYFTDTGRSWSENSVNLRDKVEALNTDEVLTSDDLIDFLKRHPKKVSISAHPERWDDDYSSWIIQFSKDCGINTVKAAIKRLRTQ